MARNALGRGLSALIREPEPPKDTTTIVLQEHTAAQQHVDIDLIDPSPYQPRTRFKDSALEELAQSIRRSGIIQPLVVRPRGARFELIAGERRWRAAQRAGLHRVPAVVREVAEDQALELTLVENIQREDLNPMEEARAFDRLMNEFHVTQEQVAERTGKDRTTIANAVRLLKLEPPLQEMIEEGVLSAGHGRALLSIMDAKVRMAVARRAARGGVTVRQIERLATRSGRARRGAPVTMLDPNTRAAIEELERELGTRVTLRPPAGKQPGQLSIDYYEESQLSGIYDRLMRR